MLVNCTNKSIIRNSFASGRVALDLESFLYIFSLCRYLWIAVVTSEISHVYFTVGCWYLWLWWNYLQCTWLCECSKPIKCHKFVETKRVHHKSLLYGSPLNGNTNQSSPQNFPLWFNKSKLFNNDMYTDKLAQEKDIYCQYIDWLDFSSYPRYWYEWIPAWLKDQNDTLTSRAWH